MNRTALCNLQEPLPLFFIKVAKQLDLPETEIEQMPDLGKDMLHGPVLLWTAGAWDDAEGALLVAALDDRHHALVGTFARDQVEIVVALGGVGEAGGHHPAARKPLLQDLAGDADPGGADDEVEVGQPFQRPVAFLLSDEAVVYRADPSGFDHLPRIYAAGGRSTMALERFRHLRSRFAEVGETLVGLSVDNRGATDIELAGGLEVKLGRELIEHKVARLVRIYRDEIQPRRAGIARLDLRYSNGFAVAWKREVLTRTDKASIWSNGNV